MLPDASGVIWKLLESSGGFWSHQGSSQETPKSHSRGIWEHLESSGGIWSHLEASEGMWNHLEASGITQEAPRRHPGGTQEHPGAPRTIQEYPGVPRSTQEHQRAPKRHPGDTKDFLLMLSSTLPNRGGCAHTVGSINVNLTPLMGS